MFYVPNKPDSQTLLAHYIKRKTFMTVLDSHLGRVFYGLMLMGKGNALRDEASALALPSGICVLRKEQLRAVQYVHQH